jgi:CheY-like chemotaxis protein
MASRLPFSSSVTVLMIDDNPQDLESWSKLLGESSSQYSILKAQTVRAALDLCQYQKVDCVVLDLDMDRSSGFEVLLRLIPDHKRPKVAVVVLTRLRNANLLETALYQGAQACLVKQLTSARDLHEAIQKAVVSVAPNAN